MRQQESAVHNSKWIIRKFEAFEDLSSERICRLYYSDVAKYKHLVDEVVEIPDNILLNSGIAEMWDLIIGDVTAVPFNNANSQIGVGSDSTTEDPIQTGLIDVAAAFVPMEAGFPVLAGQTLTFRGVYDGNTANFDWREFSVANGSPTTTGINMNRKVDVQGTKATGQTWTLDLSITLS